MVRHRQRSVPFWRQRGGINHAYAPLKASSRAASESFDETLAAHPVRSNHRLNIDWSHGSSRSERAQFIFNFYDFVGPVEPRQERFDVVAFYRTAAPDP
jgi:hypothetical protein